MQIEDQQPESEMPPTPQETQVSRKQVTFEETQAMGSPKQKVPMPQRDVSPPSRRVSEIPAALSSWFAPKRRSSGVPKPSATEDVAIPQAQRPSREDPESIDIDPALMTTIRHHLTEDLESTQADVHTDAAVRPKPTFDHSLPMSSQTEPPETQRTTLAKFGIGLRTPLSYYTPLTHMYQHLNSTSSTVDILAVVTRASKPPERAKAGAKDYYTVLSVSDRTHFPKRTQIQIFRPWKGVLPVAERGDVVLLRGFSVISNKAKPALRSNDSSAWCVWRFDDHPSLSSFKDKGKAKEDDKKKPAWAKRLSGGAGGSPFGRYVFAGMGREEVKGPPVELGAEEREEVSRLRDWWKVVEKEQSGAGGGDTQVVEDVEGVDEDGEGERARL